MDTQQFWNGVGWSTAKSALGGNTEIRNKLLRYLDALQCSLHAIGEMDYSQVEFCFRREVQLGSGA